MIDWTDRTPQNVGEVWTRRSGDETAVYHGDSLHILNASALAIWELCDGATHAGEMAQAIAEVTGLDVASAEIDVRRALDDLYSGGLITIDEGGEE
ncbi:MAG: PqqD family protein [Acidimicrobiia bacterium]|nr:PqqD family protein [Acidimicrobiia bacterium]